MPERFVEHPYHLARHRAAPLLEARRLYLSHVMQEGRAFATLKALAVLLLSIAQHVPVGRTVVTFKHIESAAERWLRSFRSGCSQRVRRIERARFIFHAKNWLRFLGKLDQSKKRHWFSTKIDEFGQFQTVERGLAPTTVLQREKDVSRFLSWIGKQHKSLQRVTAEDVSRYVQCSDVCSWKRTTIGLHISSLRTFLRFAESKRWCRKGLADTIDGPRLYRHERLPRGPKWKDVQRLLAASCGDTPTTVRNHVLLMLFAVYGFRSCEVCRLRLEDVDWERETISLVRAKQHERQCYPLVHSVGVSLLRYLREVRPATPLREIFISRKHPYRPLTPWGAYQMVRTYQRQLEIALPHYGPHSLRHACATHLLAEGFSLKEIGDHLGHKSASSTQIYAKVDLPALREVAEMDLAHLIRRVDRKTETPLYQRRRASSAGSFAKRNMGGAR